MLLLLLAFDSIRFDSVGLMKDGRSGRSWRRDQDHGNGVGLAGAGAAAGACLPGSCIFPSSPFLSFLLFSSSLFPTSSARSACSAFCLIGAACLNRFLLKPCPCSIPRVR